MSLYLGNTPIADSGNSRANTDLSNLTSQGENIANWSSNVTNCITEIPQDIKLELNNGTLTLKAGSKVYVPNGAGVFDEVTVASDMSWSGRTLNQTELVFIKANGSAAEWVNINTCYSGSSAPSGSQFMMWYDTSNNQVKFTNNSGSTWDSGWSLPVGIVTCDTTSWVSIDQVFNGFGYIGSTVFALPGIKGLIPNDRNDDLTLKNIESILTKVHTYWLDPAWGTAFNGHKFYLRVFDEGETYPGDVQPDTRVTYSKGIPSSTYTGVYYDTEENKWFWVDNGEISAHNKMFLGVSFIANITATTFTVDGNWSPKTPFHALDYNDSSTISGWSAPSSRYIDLTVGANGATYTAPANGWFAAWSASSISNFTYVALSVGSVGSGYASEAITPVNFQGPVLLPVKKGQVMTLLYSHGVAMLRFYYAEGEN